VGGLGGGGGGGGGEGGGGNETVSARNDIFVRDCCEKKRALRQIYNNAITNEFEIKRERVTEKKEPFVRYAYTRTDGMRRMEFEKWNPG